MYVNMGYNIITRRGTEAVAWGGAMGRGDAQGFPAYLSAAADEHTISRHPRRPLRQG
jgi:hypothetical protein